ncbi:MAG: phytanoyl-CoA dioxygenase family protein, partial [Actinomycetota bacterium]|nr:phytanoyl-CoA dioxygenase family protein [Actinomycetota bacterium]
MTRPMTKALTDHYPTRNNVTIGIEPRRDPVVWTPPGGGGPLRPDSVAAFDADGFLSVDDLVDADVVADLRNELDNLRADPVLAVDERSICELDSGQIRSIFEVHRISPAFAALIADPRLVGPVRQLLGSEVYVHQSRVNFKP